MEVLILAFALVMLLGICGYLGISSLKDKSRMAGLDSALEKTEKDLAETKGLLKVSEEKRAEAEAAQIRSLSRVTSLEEAAQTESQRKFEEITGLHTRAQELESKYEAQRNLVATLNQNIVRANTEAKAVREELERYKAGEADRNKLVRAEIDNMARKIFENSTGTFKQMGAGAIADLVKPVKDNLERLEKTLVESERNEAVREARLVSSIENMTKMNAQLGAQAEGLAKALKGDNKLVGDFGEEILGRLLEFSGLKRDVHYVEQGEDLALKGPDGGHLKPDVLILLPENRCLVIDSKMSLKSWISAQTENEEDRAKALGDLRTSIRAHVANLASKPYTQAVENSGRIAVDFKFLFIPIEAAFYTCLQLDRNLYEEAFRQRVILVSPTTLLAVLSTVEHTWKQFDLGRNAKQISERAALMLDKLQGFLSSMDDVGKHLERTQTAFSDATKKLSTGKGSLITQAAQLKELGVKSDKITPASFRALSDTADEPEFTLS